MKNPIICIYKITCLINNKIYIGQTINFKNRKSYHKCSLKHNRHDNKYLQEDYNNYGLSQFKFEIVEKCKVEDLLEKETYWMNYYGGINSYKLYNLKDKDNYSDQLIDIIKESNIHNPVSDKTKQKLRELNLGMNNPMYGKKQTLESNLKRSKALKNRIFSEEHKQKLLQSNKQRGKRKYDENFIRLVKIKYNELGSYTQTAHYFNINKDTCANLIKFGTSQRPYKYVAYEK